MSGVKQGFWERGATDQKTKRTNGYLTVEVKGLVATSDRPGRYDSILCCQLRRQYYLNFLVPSVRPFKSLNFVTYNKKTVVNTVFLVVLVRDWRDSAIGTSFFTAFPFRLKSGQITDDRLLSP